jgi:hypothetical protein
MAFRVKLHDHVEKEIDRLFGHFGSSLAINRLYRELETVTPDLMQDRDPGEPGEFNYPLTFEVYGLWHTLHLAVADTWQSGVLHVVGVRHERGGRALYFSPW